MITTPVESRPDRRIGLGIDAGGTATRWCLSDPAGAVLATGTTRPMTGHVYDDAQRERMHAVILDLAATVLHHDQPTAVRAGITGLDAGTPAADFYRGAIATALRIAPATVQIDNDMGLAYRAAFDLGTGILVYSGTGSVACHLTADGTHIRAGGRGVIIDDAGSGFWIAKEAIKAVMRREDRSPGSGWATPLGRAIAADVGTPTWDAVRVRVYGGDRGAVAMLAKPVAAAATEGDAVAGAILEAAGTELAALARALLDRLGPRLVILAGGTSDLHPKIGAAFRGALQDVTTDHRRLDPAAAGARAAAQAP